MLTPFQRKPLERWGNNVVRIRAFALVRDRHPPTMNQRRKVICSKTPTSLRGLRIYHSLVLAAVWVRRGRRPSFTNTVESLHLGNQEGGHQTPAKLPFDLRMSDPHDECNLLFLTLVFQARSSSHRSIHPSIFGNTFFISIKVRRSPWKGARFCELGSRCQAGRHGG